MDEREHHFVCVTAVTIEWLALDGWVCRLQ